jgi:hypothetical protein
VHDRCSYPQASATREKGQALAERTTAVELHREKHSVKDEK